MTIHEIVNCARCGGDHSDVEFKMLTRPMAPVEMIPKRYTHWAPCPENGEPIMMMVTDPKVS